MFPNAIIPQSVITTPSQNLLKYIPLPNSGPYYSTSSANETLGDDKGAFRLDYNSRFGMISGYYFIDDFNQANPYASASFPGFTAAFLGRAQMANVSDTKTFGPTAVNEFRVHYMRMINLGQGGFPEGGLGVTLDSLGFVTGPSTLGLVVQNKQYEGVPGIGFNNYSIGVPAYFGAQYNNTYQILDNFSKVKGSHTMKFGADVHYDQITEHEFGANNGTWGFDGTRNGQRLCRLSDWRSRLVSSRAFRRRCTCAAITTVSTRQDSWRVNVEPDLELRPAL